MEFEDWEELLELINSVNPMNGPMKDWYIGYPPAQVERLYVIDNDEPRPFAIFLPAMKSEHTLKKS